MGRKRLLNKVEDECGGIREDALMDVQCSYNAPTILRLSPYYGSTQLRAAQRVHRLACRMAEPTKRKSKRKKKQKRKRKRKSAAP